MLITVPDLLLALALAGVTLFLWRKDKALRQQIDDLERYSYKRFYELSGENDRLAGLVKTLKKRVRDLSPVKFTADMTVGEALEVHPRVRDVLSGANITAGGCGCHDEAELDEKTLQEVTRAQRIDLNQLLTTLNALGDGKIFVPPPTTSGKGVIQIQMAPRKDLQN